MTKRQRIPDLPFYEDNIGGGLRAMRICKWLVMKTDDPEIIRDLTEVAEISKRIVDRNQKMMRKLKNGE